MQIKKEVDKSLFIDLKKQYLNEITAPLDGMYFDGFLPQSDHFFIIKENVNIGYFCINSDGFILQFYINLKNQQKSSEYFKEILEKNKEIVKVNGALVSTAEPKYLSLCFDHFKNHSVTDLMFQKIDQKKSEKYDFKAENKLTLLKKENLDEVVEFAVDTIGMPENWCQEYFSNLINRNEIYGAWDDDNVLFATGESRGYDVFQKDYCDLGFMVHKNKQRKGVGTEIMKQLINLTENKGKIPICSTTPENVGSLKSIIKCGFYAPHRVIKFE